MAEEVRQVSEFRRIVLKDWGKLVLRPAELPSLVVEADDEFLEQVSTTVTNGTLELRVGRKWLDVVKQTVQSGLTRQKITYYLNVSELQSLEVSGAARVDAEGLSGESFSLLFGGAGEIDFANVEFGTLEVEMPGAGKLSVTGRADVQHVLLSGAGSYNGDGLESSRAVVELRGVGKATVNVKDHLKATVRGVGAVEYYGDPEVEKTVSGLGQVNRARKR